MSYIPDQDKVKADNAALRDKFFAYLREQGHTIEEKLPEFTLDGWKLIISSKRVTSYWVPGLWVTSESRYIQPRTFFRKSFDLLSEEDFPKVRGLLLKLIERGKKALVRDEEISAERLAKREREREIEARLLGKVRNLGEILRDKGVGSVRVCPDLGYTPRVTITLDEKDIETLYQILGFDAENGQDG